MESHKYATILPPHLILPAAFIRLDRLYIDGLRWEATSFVLGVAIHLTLFRKGEWDLSAHSICKAYALVFVLLSGVLVSLEGGDLVTSVFIKAFKQACVLLVAHLVGLTASICVYRQCFHRLRGFAGPPLARLSSLYMLLLSLRYHQSDTIREFHERYGDYVRICPNKLSITDPAAIAAIYGRASPAVKGVFSNTTLDRQNLNMCRDKTEHARRRKFWDRALAVNSLRGRIPTINKHAERLLGQLQARVGQRLDASEWLRLFSFDVLFDLAFGHDQRRVQRGHEGFYAACAQEVLRVTGLVIHAPWLMYFTSWIPGLGRRFAKFHTYSLKTVNERLADRSDRGDLFSMISRSWDELERKSAQDFENLVGDADLLLLAGADSIAAAIANILYQLALDPAAQEALRQALAGVEDYEEFQLRGNVQLDAFVNESLRMNPPAPTGHERMTPPEGLQINGRHIPGNVSVFVPHYALFRDARFFEQPDGFIPERWTSRPELTKDPSVFVPFQYGRNACPGRWLALMEIRTMIFSIVSRYSIRPGSADITTDFIDKREDGWLLAVGKLDIVLEQLEGGRAKGRPTTTTLTT